MNYVRISDLKDPNDPQGRSYREVNAEKQHAIPIGALVEVEPSEKRPYKNGIRLFVVYHTRDCDETPLYCLAANPDDTVRHQEGFYNSSWACGFSEDALTVIELPPSP